MNAMLERNQQNRPFWVKLGLCGLPTRASVWVCFWLSVGMATGSVLYGLVDRRFFVGGIMLLAALWYYASIRWVDHHGGWSKKEE
jgi:hypothetical protein